VKKEHQPPQDMEPCGVFRERISLFKENFLIEPFDAMKRYS